MSNIDDLFKKNAAWAEDIKASDPTFFERLSAQQTPEYLWIGCSDSRVPANQIVGLLPGEIFVHRNIANSVVHTDLNCLSVIYYAVEVLKVKHVIVCGHYGCGGVNAAMRNQQHGLIDHWIRNIRDVYHQHEADFAQVEDEKARLNLLCEINVKQQMANVCSIPAIQNAWRDGQDLTVHAWIYDIKDGLLKSLSDSVSSADNVPSQYRVGPPKA